MKIAYSRWNEIQKLSKEIDSYKEKIENQKILDRAKGIYSKDNKISEYEAHKAILSISMNKQKPLVFICEEIIKKNIAIQK